MSIFSGTLNEKDVKKMLDIDDFRQLTKDKVIDFVSYLDKMDPEVAKKALEQVPEFALTAREAINKMDSVIRSSLEHNKDSVNCYYETAENTSKTLREMLNSDNLSEEMKRHIIDKLIEIIKLVGQKETEDKAYRSNETNKFIYGTLATVGMLALSLGIGIALRKPFGFTKA